MLPYKVAVPIRSNHSFQAVDLIHAGSWPFGDLVCVQRFHTPSMFHWNLFHIDSKEFVQLFTVYPATVGNDAK